MAARRSLPPTLRGVSLLVGCAAAALGAWSLSHEPVSSLAGPVLADGPGALADLPLDRVVTGVCALALLGCTVWVLTTTAAVVLVDLGRLLAPDSAALGTLGAAVDRACPAVVRGVVTATLGLALGTAVAAPALADPASGPSTTHDTGRLTGLALPDRTTGAASATSASRTPALRRALRPTRVVTVRPGDSLWSIAADLLPTHADDAAITRTWQHLHHVNAARVGKDPDLILPGTRLLVPDDIAPHREERP